MTNLKVRKLISTKDIKIKCVGFIDLSLLQSGRGGKPRANKGLAAADAKRLNKIKEETKEEAVNVGLGNRLTAAINRLNNMNNK